MNLTFTMANALTALLILGALLGLSFKVGNKIGEWITELQTNIKALTDGQAQHGNAIAGLGAKVEIHDREIGEIMGGRRYEDGNPERRHP
jgi:hypothetical protein